jgi:hypothetical protein
LKKKVCWSTAFWLPRILAGLNLYCDEVGESLVACRRPARFGRFQAPNAAPAAFADPGHEHESNQVAALRPRLPLLELLVEVRMTHGNKSTVIDRYFAGLTEQTFEGQLGVVDPPLVDYLANMLIRFVKSDSVYRVRALNGRPVYEVAEMVVEAEHRIGDARREVHRHIGDFTLFWTGMYPEAIRELRSPQKKDYFVDYLNQGKRAYHIAATIQTEHEEQAPRDVLERLSRQFEMCMYGLGEIRREWERRDDGERKMLID